MYRYAVRFLARSENSIIGMEKWEKQPMGCLLGIRGTRQYCKILRCIFFLIVFKVGMYYYE